MTVDLRHPEFVSDPYPALAELRKAGPLVWHEASDRWLATTHDAVSRVLRDRAFGRIWTDWEPADEMAPFNALHKHQMMENEQPEHTRLRRLVAGAFGRGHVERLRPRIESLVEQMLDRLDGTVDVLGEYAEPLPVFVIADLLGVPRADHVQLRAWSQAIVHMYEHDVDQTVRDEAVSAAMAFADYVRGVVVDRRAQPGEDLISDLIAERDGSARLSDDELVASVVLLLNAGHEASVNVFGNGAHALLTHPEQLARVTAGAVPMATALEELLRYDAPLQLFERTATADIEVAGVTVRRGQKVACLMGSANRDELVFADAATLDVGRDPNPHVGFGMGLHFCLGAPLARLELEITFRRLLERWPALELAAPAPRRPTWVLRGLDRLDVHLEKP
ncbi:cytochrome P450 [Aeromicrobium sp.]|uniref:cytochrome P450 n=1 Tax=Aeromicrobium sp. TaxID=1871063 RepID=UPI003D6BCCCF